MSFFETRDFRSSARDSKRTKDHNTKWANGIRASPGVKAVWTIAGPGQTGRKEQQEKSRPEKAPRFVTARLPKRHRAYETVVPKRYEHHNINKPDAPSRGDMPISHWRTKVSNIVELQESSNLSNSLLELLPSPAQQNLAQSEDFLYNFDRSESPGKPLSLDVYIKPNAKETEKFVEKEYEILDNNGEAVKGRKARMNLRHGKSLPAAEEPKIVEEEGFELV
ncbi:hypothetical protein F5Y16DRAFT_176521 [Xylariaceae sp. FL0255]|nr:hypothetical protein F5Y16DRAFT_176521 [Xylariaceae sp. FL0255]